MPLQLYSLSLSPYCRSVLMLAKELNLELDVKDVNVIEGQQFSEEYLKMNPAHSIPTLVNDGFVLWESRAILRYLCNKLAPDSTLYPKEAEKRAIVDRWLDFDISLEKSGKATWGSKLFTGVEPDPDKVTVFKNNLKLMDQLIGSNKYLTGDHLTIADLSIAAINHMLPNFQDISEYPNIKRWLTTITSELPYFSQINVPLSAEQFAAFKTTPAAQQYFKRKLIE